MRGVLEDTWNIFIWVLTDLSGKWNPEIVTFQIFLCIISSRAKAGIYPCRTKGANWVDFYQDKSNIFLRGIKPAWLMLSGGLPDLERSIDPVRFSCLTSTKYRRIAKRSKSTAVGFI